MCGIVGIFKFSGDFSEAGELQSLNRAMIHRGPDEQGSFSEGRIGLAMRRLSIIDLAGGHQPMESSDRRFVIIFNGECYNYQNVRQELEGLGRRFSTHSDTEVVLVGYQQWGAAVLDRLVGMWGLAIYDRASRELFLARDRLGKKQIYYSLDQDRLVFGSEMGVVMMARKENKLRLEALPEFLNYSYVGGYETAIEGVRLLPEGHWAKISEDGRMTLRAYWNLTDLPAQMDGEEEAAEAAYAMIVDAVRLRLTADVPVSVMLSSGLDSSTIAYVLAKELGAPLHAFSIGFDDGDFDEATDAGQFARAMDLPWSKSIVTGAQVAADFATIIRHGSSLQANTAQIVYFYTNQLIRQGNYKVALNGSGGDELFAGYPTYRATQFYSRYGRLPAGVRAGVSALAERLPVSQGRVSFDYAAKKFAACPYPDPRRAHGYWRTIFSTAELDQLLAPEVRAARGADTRIYDAAFQELGGTDVAINTLLRADLKAWLTPMLPWTDNMSMAHGVELRFPFLDHRLVQYALGLPPSTLFRGWRLKRVMKRFLKGRLPDRVLHRKKRGTHVPLGRWLNRELKDLAGHYLDQRTLNRNGLFNQVFVDRLRREHASLAADHTFKLWNLISYSAWREAFRVGI